MDEREKNKLFGGGVGWSLFEGGNSKLTNDINFPKLDTVEECT